MRPLWTAIVCCAIVIKCRCQKDPTLYFDKSKPDQESTLGSLDYERSKYQTTLFDSGKAVDKIDDSAMYRSHRFEGDIVNPGLRADTVKAYLGEANPSETSKDLQGVMRNAVKQTYLMWPDGKIPYTISTQYSSYSRSKIAEALDEYAKQTCIQFVPKTADQTDYVHIFPEDGCYSLVGRTGGKQPLSLGDGCIQKGIIIHELMHSVGFFHEQSRADRDDYITVVWKNVEPGLEDQIFTFFSEEEITSVVSFGFHWQPIKHVTYQFEKYSLNMITHLGTPYDYGSIMHYARDAFSKDGQDTITTKVPGVEIGQRRGFSPNDLYKIKKLYSCADAGLVTPQPDPLKPNGVTAAPTTTPAAPSSGTASCDDKRRDCASMAKYGHCESRWSSKFMAENCPKSCKKCGSSSGSIVPAALTCADSRTWCERWAESGMCTQPIFKDYMKSKCQKSCNFC